MSEQGNDLHCPHCQDFLCFHGPFLACEGCATLFYDAPELYAQLPKREKGPLRTDIS